MGIVQRSVGIFTKVLCAPGPGEEARLSEDRRISAQEARDLALRLATGAWSEADRTDDTKLRTAIIRAALAWDSAAHASDLVAEAWSNPDSRASSKTMLAVLCDSVTAWSAATEASSAVAHIERRMKETDR